MTYISKTPLSKLIAVVMSACLMLSAFPAESSTNSPDVSQTENPQMTRSVGDVVIPAKLGIVDDRFEGNTGRIIFHIKDAHCNYYAQKSIYALIEWIVERYGADIINLEGGAGEYDLSLLENIREKPVKETITDRYLREGKLNGAELYRVFNPSKVSLAGIEDEDLYETDLAAYRAVLADHDNVRAFIDAAKRCLVSLRKECFSPELVTFDDTKELFRNNKLPIGKYIAYLLRTSSALDVRTDDLGDLMLLSKALVKEKEIDFKAAERERERMMDASFGRFSRYERDALLSRVNAAEEGYSGEEAVYSYLFTVAGETGMDTCSFRNFKAYSEYLEIYKNINDSRLFEEVRLAEKRIEETLTKTREEKDVYFYLTEMRLLEGMMRLRLDRRGYEESRGFSGTESVIEFLTLRGADEKETAVLREKALSVENAFANMAVFYALAEKRDDAFLRNIDSNMKKSASGVSIVVTGGFHSDNLLSKLKGANVSYVSIKPSFLTDGDGDGPYLELLSGRYRNLPGDVYSLLSSTIQVKSLWSDLGMDTDFAAAFLLKLNTAIEEAKQEGVNDVILVLGKRKVHLAAKTGYKPALAFPVGWEKRPDCRMIDLEKLMDMSAGEILSKLSPLEDKEEMLDTAVALTGETEMADTLKLLMFKGIAYGKPANSRIADKRAYLLTYEGKVIEGTVRGMRNLDTYVYIFDVRTGTLMCQFSSSRSMSGYMTNPSRVTGDNEKSYLCARLREVFKPGLTAEQKKAILKGLIEEQKRYEAQGLCGWDWVIDRDEDGSIYVDDNLGFGLRSFIVYDRSKLPDGITPQNIEDDAEIYGGRENVQEMEFEITPLGGDKVKILLINNWAAAARVKNLEEAAYKDPLTGLWNRRYFSEKVKSEMRSMTPASVLFIDADHFKLFNDTYSHQFGDTVLKIISRVLLKNIRGSDVAIRWGGEEMVVILPDTPVSSGRVVAEKILRSIKRIRPSGIRDEDKVSVTIGVVGVGTAEEGEDIDSFIDQADKAMYAAKQRQRGIVFVMDKVQASGPAGEEKAAVTAIPGEIPWERVIRDLNDVIRVHMTVLMSSLHTFLTKEMMKGMSQGEGLKSIYRDLTGSEFAERLEKLTQCRRELNEKVTDLTEKEKAAGVARTEMRKLYLYLSRIRERMYNVVGDTPASPRVGAAMVSVESMMDLTFKYLDVEDREGMMASPYITIDGEPLMWLTGDGVIIWHPAMHGQSNEMQRWNMRHEKWERRLHDGKETGRYSRAARDVAAMFFAFNEFDRLTDEKLDNWLYSIFPEYWLTDKEKRYEDFVRGAVSYLRETSVEFFRGTAGEELERESLALVQNVLFAEAIETCSRQYSGTERHNDSLLLAAYIGGERPDLMTTPAFTVLEQALRTPGIPGRVSAEVCRSVVKLSERSSNLIRPSLVIALNILFERQGMDPKTYTAAAEAMKAIGTYAPGAIVGNFRDMPPALQLSAISGALGMGRTIPEELRPGDRKAIELAVSCVMREYLIGNTRYTLFDEIAGTALADTPALPVLRDGSPAVTEDQFWRTAASRESVKAIIAKRYIEPMASSSRGFENAGLPSLEGTMSVNLKGVSKGERERVKWETPRWAAIGLEQPAVSPDGSSISFRLPECSDSVSQTAIIHAMRQAGLIPKEGTHLFSQSVASRMPDEVKIIQLANLVMYPTKYNWRSMPCDGKEAGIPPLAYGTGDRKDATVFPGGVVNASDVVSTDTAVMRYSYAMGYFSYMQRSKQMLSWALSASMVPPAKRDDTQKLLAGEWAGFKAGIEAVLRKHGLTSYLLTPEWISVSAMDGVAPNENGWTYGSVSRRQTIQEGLEKLEEARRSGKIIGEVTDVMAVAVKNIDALAAARRAELRTLQKKREFWKDKEPAIFGPGADDLEVDAGDPLRDILTKTEAAVARESAASWKGEALRPSPFTALIGAFLEQPEDAGGGIFGPARDKGSLDDAVARMAIRMTRFPGEMRVILYPVYGEMTYSQEISATSQLRKRLAENDYGFRLCLLPYLAGNDASRSIALEKMADVAGKDNGARIMIYADTGFVDSQGPALRQKYGDKVVLVKEEGSSSAAEGVSYIGAGLRTAFALAVIDYFDPRNGYKGRQRENLRDSIAAMIGLMTGSRELMALFSSDPESLIKGLIVIKPAERILWNEAAEKVQATRQFLHSL